MALKMLYLAVIFLLFVSIAGALPENEYKITYTINVKDDGTAIWNVEYRTTLATKEDFDSFENYTQQIKSVNLPEFTELMQKSASEASAATSRSMAAGDFTGNAAVQSTPTGTYGVIYYSFTWKNFAEADSDINIGDVFVGGLYLSKDDTLIIKYPFGYVISEVTPKPDVIRDGMLWYGLRSFGAGEPKITLSRTSYSWIPSVVVIFAIAIGVFFIFFTYRRKIRNKDAKAEIMDLEERIIKLLKESGGSLYQSEIVRRLSLPKSTVSTALNELYNKNMINKIKKGRENLIRLI